MVATLVRLRFLLLRNQLTRSTWQLIAAILGGLYGLGMLVVAVGGLIALAWVPLESARTIVVLAGAVVVLGWIVIPPLTSGIDQTVDPARLAPFPIPVDTLLRGMLVSGVLGVPGIVTLIAALATVGTWIRSPLAAVAAVLCAVIGVLTAVAGSRMLIAVASRIGAGRRAREAKTALVIIPLVLLGPIIILVSGFLRNASASLPIVSDVVGFTPFGAIWAVPADLAAGEPLRAGLEFLIGLATLGVIIVVWRWALTRALERPAQPAAAKVSRRGLGLFGRFPGTPAGAVAARSLTYWMRDPRYSQSLISIPLVPLLVFFYAGLNGNLVPLVWVGPIIAALLSMSIFTDVAYDNTAYALHLQTGLSGRADRIGRVAALAVFAVPVALVITVVCVAVTSQWQLLLGLLGVTVGLLLSGFAVSSVLSGAFVFPVPAPGDNPFKARPGGGASLLLSSLLSWGALSVLVLPELVLAIIGFVTGSVGFGIASLLVGLVLGGVLLVIGVRVGGSILDRRGPALLATMRAQR